MSRGRRAPARTAPPSLHEPRFWLWWLTNKPLDPMRILSRLRICWLDEFPPCFSPTEGSALKQVKQGVRLARYWSMELC